MLNVPMPPSEVWAEDIDAYACTFTELIRQPYTNCAFSAGTVEGHPIDTLYLRFEKEGREMLYLLRPDEMAAIGWCATGVLWSDALAKLPEES
jgi:hypothetical protein